MAKLKNNLNITEYSGQKIATPIALMSEEISRNKMFRPHSVNYIIASLYAQHAKMQIIRLVHPPCSYVWS